MREVQYKTFSLKAHKKNWRVKNPNVCQFELTFRCGLRCKHCYTDCYNKPSYLKKELKTRDVKSILDKVYNAGVLWCCFTGGDPLTRKDFLNIYSYAKDKGFIVTIFTSGYSITREIAQSLAQRPPFAIELTLNGVMKGTFERISQVPGSFKRVMRGIDLILEHKLPLKIKTQVTKDNLTELPAIKEFVEKRGIKFRPSLFLHARLNGNLMPCSSRIKPEEVVSLNKDARLESFDEECNPPIPHPEARRAEGSGKTTENPPTGHLFRCAIGGGDGLYIDPFGNLVPCNGIRKPKINVLKEDVEEGKKKVLNIVRNKRFGTQSECRYCSIKEVCCNCPGKALLETGNLEQPVDWFCKLAHLVSKNRESTTVRTGGK